MVPRALSWLVAAGDGHGLGGLLLGREEVTCVSRPEAGRGRRTPGQGGGLREARSLPEGTCEMSQGGCFCYFSLSLPCGLEFPNVQGAPCFWRSPCTFCKELRIFTRLPAGGERQCWVGPERASGVGSPLSCDGDLGQSPKLCHRACSPEGRGLVLPLGASGPTWVSGRESAGRVGAGQVCSRLPGAPARSCGTWGSCPKSSEVLPPVRLGRQPCAAEGVSDHVQSSQRPWAGAGGCSGVSCRVSPTVCRVGGGGCRRAA